MLSLVKTEFKIASLPTSQARRSKVKKFQAVCPWPPIFPPSDFIPTWDILTFRFTLEQNMRCLNWDHLIFIRNQLQP